MPIFRLLAAVAAFAGALLLTLAMFRVAKARGLLDVPNERSSHQVPTPRGGGAAIVIAATVALGLFATFQGFDRALAIALIGGSLAVAVIGFIDDHGSVQVRIRMAIHVAAALWALWWLGGLPLLTLGATVVPLGPVGYVLGTLVVVWTLNLFNFMDGIDGIAASEAVFIGCAGAGLTLLGGGSHDVATAGFIFAAACAGFLVWNWPPARIFMGDVGSGYLGYVVAVLALAAARRDPTQVWVWLILGGSFFVDATVTLVRRLARGDRVYEAHRSHAYQWLARRWKSHKRVTLTFLAVNVVWLLPCALLAEFEPNHAAWIAVLALTPLIPLAVAAGAGRREAN